MMDDLKILVNCQNTLGLYLYTLIIGHKLCSMLDTLNESLQKELRHFMYIMHFGTQSKSQQNNNIKHKNLGRYMSARVN